MRNSAARLWQIYENSPASRIDGGTLRHLAGGCKEFWEQVRISLPVICQDVPEGVQPLVACGG